MRTKFYFLIILGVIILAVSVAFGLFKFTGRNPQKIDCAGEKFDFRSFKLSSLQGDQVETSEFQGKVILLNFWTTWCSPCRAEIPHLNALYEKYKKDGLVIIGVSLDYGSPEPIRRFVEKAKMEYIILMGGKEVVEAFQGVPGIDSIQGIPTTFIIDRKGQTCRRFIGFTERKVLEESIKQHL